MRHLNSLNRKSLEYNQSSEHFAYIVQTSHQRTLYHKYTIRRYKYVHITTRNCFVEFDKASLEQ